GRGLRHGHRGRGGPAAGPPRRVRRLDRRPRPREVVRLVPRAGSPVALFGGSRFPLGVRPEGACTGLYQCLSAVRPAETWAVEKGAGLPARGTIGGRGRTRGCPGRAGRAPPTRRSARPGRTPTSASPGAAVPPRPARTAPARAGTPRHPGARRTPTA